MIVFVLLTDDGLDKGLTDISLHHYTDGNSFALSSNVVFVIVVFEVNTFCLCMIVPHFQSIGKISIFQVKVVSFF